MAPAQPGATGALYDLAGPTRDDTVDHGETRMSDDFTAALAALERSSHPPERFSDPFVEFLPVSGAAVSTLGDILGSETLSASDVHAARLDEVQFDLGEGPCWDAMRSVQPVVEASLQTAGRERWPSFAAAVEQEPVTSIFAFPLVVGTLKLGAVDLYSVDPVQLDAHDSQRASALAGVIGRHILRDALSGGDGSDIQDLNPRSRRTIHQATGFVLAQLGTSPDDALLIIQGHAFASSLPMMDVASDIIEGRLSFRRHQGRIEVSP